jgi:hypothetical protein
VRGAGEGAALSLSPGGNLARPHHNNCSFRSHSSPFLTSPRIASLPVVPRQLHNPRAARNADGDEKPVVARSFYRRPLPSRLVPFNSSKGKALLSGALSEEGGGAFFEVMGNFDMQNQPVSCGLASLAMALNILDVTTWRHSPASAKKRPVTESEILGSLIFSSQARPPVCSSTHPTDCRDFHSHWPHATRSPATIGRKDLETRAAHHKLLEMLDKQKRDARDARHHALNPTESH